VPACMKYVVVVRPLSVKYSFDIRLTQLIRKASSVTRNPGLNRAIPTAQTCKHGSLKFVRNKSGISIGATNVAFIANHSHGKFQTKS
jgi:hypothetical protein